MQNLIEIIQKHSLTIRCLPHVVISHFGYREGDEKRLKKNQTIVELPKWNNRKFIREERTVKHGGWWYVKETKNTNGTIRFNLDFETFLAPTIEEAISLYLNSING